MGRLEKIVVLTVLFLVAVVLGVALNPSDPAADPLAGPLSQPGPTPSQGAESPTTPTAAPTRPPIERGDAALRSPGGVLNADVSLNPGPETDVAPAALPGRRRPRRTEGAANAGPARASDAGVSESQVDPGAPKANPELLTSPSAKKPAQPGASRPQAVTPATQPALEELTRERAALEPVRGLLLTTEGLRQSLAPDMMLYAWQRGDTFAGLARHFYGSQSKLRLLAYANEGRGEGDLRPGEQIWIPIFDSQEADAPDGGTIYVVEAGDYLGRISKKIYGSSREWKRIFDANRDLLDDPDNVTPGMHLRIPQ